jgi:hypothetical protein
MDDVPLPLAAPITGPPSAAVLLREAGERLAVRQPA